MKQDPQASIEQAINALLTCPRTEDAARQCGVSRTTLWRLKQDPTFQRRFHDARLRLSEEIVTTLLANTLDAVSTLRKIMLDKRTVSSTRVAAAGKLVDLTLRAKQQLDVDQRLSALELALQSRNGDKK